jgi:hypothetical protein
MKQRLPENQIWRTCSDNLFFRQQLSDLAIHNSLEKRDLRLAVPRQAVDPCHYFRVFHQVWSRKRACQTGLRAPFVSFWALLIAWQFTCQIQSARPSAALAAVRPTAPGTMRSLYNKGQKGPFGALTSVVIMESQTQAVHNSLRSRELPSRKNISFSPGFVVSVFESDDRPRGRHPALASLVTNGGHAWPPDLTFRRSDVLTYFGSGLYW